MRAIGLRETPEERVTRLVVEYARSTPMERPLPPGLSLRRDLAIESLSLVSLVLRLGDEMAIDLWSSEIELGTIDTVGDLLVLAREHGQ